MSIIFNTEFEINFPGEKEDSYFTEVNTNVGKFLGKSTIQSLWDVNLTYNPKNRTNIVSFKWKDLENTNSVLKEFDAIKSASKMEYWFHHCPFFRKHSIRNFATSYNIKDN